MNEWVSRFSKEVTERGKNLYENHKVADLKKTDKGYTAAVLGRFRYKVEISMINSDSPHMKCSCPVSKSGRYCEHMAAVCYAAAEEADGERAKKEVANAAWRLERLTEAWKIIRSI
ncbi:MAG: SWIM zinc finger family protein [Candidatus Choladocola sp.]|nr:SWIM zinc finger family protein [Candidatus Choladocola sp.]